jgi:HK97 family phage portal protein
MALSKKIAIFNQTGSPQAGYYGNYGAASYAGEVVNEFTALGISTVFSCVTLLANTVASMPLRAYRMVGTNRVNEALPMVLADPDPLNSNTFELVHQIVTSMALHGNAYLNIDRDKFGNAIGLVPLHPYQMQVLAGFDQSTRRYLFLGNELDPANVLHLRALTPPQSLVGVSPLNQSRTMLGLNLAMDRHLAQFYGEGATPSSVIETGAKELSRDQAAVIRDTFEASHKKHRRVAVLSSGMTWKAVNASASDQQMMELKESTVREVARIFQIPVHMISGMGDNQTYQNVENANLNFLTHTIMPWLVRLEKAFSKLIPTGLDVVFDTSTLLRSDAISRAKVNYMHVQMGARNPNEVRILEGDQPYDGGNVFHQVMQGNPLAGGAFPALGEEPTSTTPVLGILD